MIQGCHALLGRQTFAVMKDCWEKKKERGKKRRKRQRRRKGKKEEGEERKGRSSKNDTCTVLSSYWPPPSGLTDFCPANDSGHATSLWWDERLNDVNAILYIYIYHIWLHIISLHGIANAHRQVTAGFCFNSCCWVLLSRCGFFHISDDLQILGEDFLLN